MHAQINQVTALNHPEIPQKPSIKNSMLPEDILPTSAALQDTHKENLSMEHHISTVTDINQVCNRHAQEKNLNEQVVDSRTVTATAQATLSDQ
ncbi:hypothetical protein FRX31_020619, partial [Thalictrum thalictroides]